MRLHHVAWIDEKLRGSAAQSTSSEPLHKSQVLLLHAMKQLIFKEFVEEKLESAEGCCQRAVDGISLPESTHALATIQLE